LGRNGKISQQLAVVWNRREETLHAPLAVRDRSSRSVKAWAGKTTSASLAVSVK
jgi:hypothetical protein